MGVVCGGGDGLGESKKCCSEKKPLLFKKKKMQKQSKTRGGRGSSYFARKHRLSEKLKLLVWLVLLFLLTGRKRRSESFGRENCPSPRREGFSAIFIPPSEGLSLSLPGPLPVARVASRARWEERQLGWVGLGGSDILLQSERDARAQILFVCLYGVCVPLKETLESFFLTPNSRQNEMTTMTTTGRPRGIKN